MEILRDLADGDFRNWIGEAGRTLAKDDPRREFLDVQRRMVLLQKNTASMLKCLSSNSCDIDRAWLVRQALHHGGDHDTIRGTVITYLRRARPTRFGVGHTRLISFCDEAGLLLPEDDQVIEEIKTVRAFLSSMADEGTSPSWASLPDAKRAEFYRFKR
jgi:hypothetical protein